MDDTTSYETIRWDTDSDGIVLLTLDDPNRPVNTMNDAHVRSMDAVLDRLAAERDGITGVIITSAKPIFFAGADLNWLVRATPDNAAEIAATTARVRAQLRRLEKLGRPVVAAINGSALGAGLELALACHHRIATVDDTIEIGLPEVTLGLMPGAGGTVRTVRLLGLVEALTQVLLRGQRHRPHQAAELGLVDELAPAGELLDRARQWIASRPNPAQPWDNRGYRIPGGTPTTPALAAILPSFPATLRKQLRGAPYPAPHHILCAAVEGAQVDLDTALAVEGRYFVELACGQTAKNMTKAFFFDLQSAKAPRTGTRSRPVTRAGILGAGMMGAAIAYVCARSGMEVVLKDVTVEAAERGKAFSAALVEKAAARSQAHPGAPNGIALLDRIRPTATMADLAGCDLVVEAVFEDPDLKQQVFAEVQNVVGPDAVLASNTSTLPITLLAQAVRRPEDVIGLHFFSPAEKMPLVEVIRGEHTSDATLGRALELVRQIRKTPIVVNDSRGFFTSRVIATFVLEGIAMLAEGLAPASIEQASAQAGYPTPVLALMDEVTLTLPRKIRALTAAAVRADGGQWTDSPADAVIARMVDEFHRPGRAGGAGFYDYVDGQRTRLWPGLYEHYVRPGASIPFEDMKERMLFVEAIESARCLEEGVLTSALDANIGSLLGIGFPGWTGGVLRYIGQYPGGLDGFLARAGDLASRYGERFTPPRLLLAMAERGETFT